MASLNDVFNLALSACGNTSLISDPDENTKEAKVCRLWLPLVRKGLIIAAPWPSARSYSRLARTAERADGSVWPGFPLVPARRYVYAAPADLLLPLYLQSFQPFEYSSGGIATDEENPLLYYNRNLEDPADWDPLFEHAVVYALAAAIARPVGAKAELIPQNYELASIKVEEMKVAAANSQEERLWSEPDWIAARGYVGPNRTRFFFPYSSFNAEYSR